MDVQQHRLLFVWNEVSDNATEGLPSAGALEDGSFEPGFRNEWIVRQPNKLGGV